MGYFLAESLFFLSGLFTVPIDWDDYTYNLYFKSFEHLQELKN